jgi:hypothetical protein
MHTRSLIHLQLNAVRVKPPIKCMAETFKSTFGRLYGPFDASGATDHTRYSAASTGIDDRRY